MNELFQTVFFHRIISLFVQCHSQKLFFKLYILLSLVLQPKIWGIIIIVAIIIITIIIAF